MSGDLFSGAVESHEELQAIYEKPSYFDARKQISEIDEMAARFIACSPLVFVASFDAKGNCDVTPRGGPPGFVSVADPTHLVIPDATGNKRVDTLHNVVETGRIGLMFLIPGRGQTLRISGAARVTTRPDVLAGLTSVGKPPLTAIVVRAEEVFTHCSKAFVRSKTWQPQTWLSPSKQPSPAEVMHAHLRLPEVSLAMVERVQQESLLHRLQ
ncbi:PPOX class probable FMN-dependent enzyme [Crossiella equi]|uniref:PPOX class probable FMN-dependent enzyme n=1 Tax=Crossiella equi TaxID=130796 RepID=A0ABS5A482_9PSEU|nr:MSMEG_1061 family FMN-dependent PPOX-type flavoprotein [Crossiella equi]MBP2471383.1 PPOX class probable FMN-dependent enzyme [Crossiella equi]